MRMLSIDIVVFFEESQDRLGMMIHLETKHLVELKNVATPEPKGRLAGFLNGALQRERIEHGTSQLAVHRSPSHHFKGDVQPLRLFIGKQTPRM